MATTHAAAIAMSFSTRTGHNIMFKNIFGTRIRKREFQSIDVLTKTFARSYGNLGLAVTLCEGLEIIAANAAAETLLERDAESISQNLDRRKSALVGELINAILDDQKATDTLFDGNKQAVEFQFGNKHIEIQASPWQHRGCAHPATGVEPS